MKYYNRVTHVFEITKYELLELVRDKYPDLCRIGEPLYNFTVEFIPNEDNNLILIRISK